LTAITSAHAAGNQYDVLGRTIAPVVSLFSTASSESAVQAEFALEAFTGAPREVLGSRIDFAMQPPDRLRISGAIFDEAITLCRDRQRVWAAPGRKFQRLLSHFEPLPKPEPGFTMGRFQLPLPPEQIALLPALFVVREKASEDVDGVPCRVLDLKLIPEISKNLRIDSWSAQLWITPDLKPARLRLARPGWEIVIGIRDVRYLPGIPDPQWRPPVDETDVFFFNAGRLSQLMQVIERQLRGGVP
jgi:hypothetical protein